jgi:nucleotidyltransferase/DNA polymerase involved in DNA repair
MIGTLHIPYFATTLYATKNHLPVPYPLALVAHESIYALNLAAEQAGLQRHMPEREARSRAPDVLFRAAEPLRDAEALAGIMECVQAHVERVEPVSSPQMPHILMEMPVRKQADQVAIAQDMGRTVRDLSRLTPTFGIARTLFTARTAAATTPPGNVRYIAPGRDHTLLAPLPLALLPLSGDTLSRLERLGIVTIGQFATLPVASVLHHFGADAKLAHAIANGRDPTPLRSVEPVPALEISHLFEDPVTYRQPLDAVLSRMSEELSLGLRLRRVSTSLVRLIVMTEDGEGYERKAPLRDPLRESAALAEVFARLLRLIPISSGVVEMQVILEGLGSPVSGMRQLGFMDSLHPKGMLERFFPRLLERYGHTPFWRVHFRAERDGYPPEEQFEMVPF